MIPSGNYFEKKNVIEHYIDSVIKSREALNLPKTGLGLGSYQRWLDFWKFYMPASGNFEEAKLIYNADLQQSKFEHFSKITKQNNQDKSINVPPVTFKEIGPKSFRNFFGAKENGVWVNHDNQQTLNRIDCHLGLVHSLYQHPTDDNVVFALAGGKNTNGGGLFKSSDGGYTWTILNTDQIPASEIVSFDIKPKLVEPSPANEIMFIAGAKGTVYRSIDGGITWLEAGYNGISTYPVVFNPTNPNLSNSLPIGGYFFYASVNEAKIRKLLFVPKNHASSSIKNRLVVTFEDEIYFSDNSWANITPNYTNFTLDNQIVWTKFDTQEIKSDMLQTYPLTSGATNRKIVFGDFEYCKVQNQLIYVTQAIRFDYIIGNGGDEKVVENGIRQFILYSFDFGDTWQYLGSPSDINNPNGTFLEDYREAIISIGNIEVRSNEPNYLYIANTHPAIGNQNYGTTRYLLHRYDFNAINNNWTDLTNTNVSSVIGTVPQAFSIDVNNDDNYWFYTNSYHIRSNGALSNYFPGYGVKYHADVRDFLLLRNGQILIGTDGGIFRSTDGGHNFRTSSEGLNAVQSHNMAVAQQPPFYVASGFWHGGFNVFSPAIGTDGEWHNAKIGDGKGGEIFFLNNEVFTALDVNSNARKITNFDNLNGGSYIQNTGTISIGKTRSSENKSGRAYAVRRYYFGANNPGNKDAIVYSNDELTTFDELNLQSIGIILPLMESTPYVIPNEPDLLVVTTLKRLYVISGMNQTSPTPTLLNTLEFGNGLGASFPSSGNFKKVIFDPRKNGICYLIVNEYPTWNELDKTKRLYQYNYLTNELTNITFKTDDYVNSTTRTDHIPKWYYLNDIELDRQTGVLYLATTHGIYYLDRADETWKKYDINVPVFGSLMGIIHCTGDIYLSTQARGIWKGSLIRNEQTPTLEWKITSSQTWSDRTNLFCNLIVEPGVTLTVTGKIIVYGKQKIFVKPGGKLIIDGGIIISECGDFWQGIEVWGNSALAQNGLNQGTIILKNGATIENAREAIRVWKEDDWNSGGGIIDASNSFFKNNRRSVEYMPYHSYTSTGIEIKNKGKFVNCAFTWDDNYYGGEVEAGITMFHVNGVLISGCDFIDNRTNALTIENRPDGIYTIDAGYKVLGRYLYDYISDDQDDYYSEINYDVCLFKNLQNGVYAMNSNSQSSITVDHCKFEDMVNGVVVRAMDNAVVTRNKFDFTNNHPANLSAMSGIELVSSTAFMIEGNRFLNQATNTGTSGCLVYDAGVAQNQVYRNLYSSLYTGNYAYGQNSNDLNGFIQSSGLQFLCNTYSNTKKHDLYVLADESFGDGQGIRAHQGMFNESAGNVFSSLPPGQNDKFHIVNTDNNNMRYYYADLTGQKPTFTNGLVIPLQVPSPYINACPSHFSDFILGIPPMLKSEKKQELLLSLASMNTTYGIKKQDLEQKLLMHDAPAVHELVLNLTIANKTAVKKELLTHSPYLSEALLIALGEKTPSIFPNAWFKELISANIEIMQSKSFVAYLETKTNPLPSGLLTLLKQEKNSNSSERGVKLDELASLSTKKTQVLNLLIQNELSDSATIIWDEVDNFISQRDDIIKLSQKADLHLGKSELAPCNARLDELDAQLNEFVMPDIQQEMKDFSTFKHYILSFANQRGIIEHIDDKQKQQLTFMADNFRGKSAVQARNLLCFHLGLCEELKPVYAPLKRSNEHSASSTSISSESLNGDIKIVPNPSSGEFRIEMSESCELAQINITDIEGRVLSYQTLEETNTTKRIKVENAPTGLYFVRVLCTDGASFVSRVLIR